MHAHLHTHALCCRQKKRAGRGGWANPQQRHSATQDIGNDITSTDLNKPKIILFFLGSLCYSEMRAAYEVSNASGYECYVGSHCILSPKEYVKGVGNLSHHPKEESSEQAQVVAKGDGDGALTIVTGTAV
eukprot:m.94683 g.94683  ORF g.94683 m.94683 type:complete len:130 (+) comp12420_c0_seq4:2706-3095(+)